VPLADLRYALNQTSNTRFKRCAQRIAARRSIGVRAPALAALALRLPRPALVTAVSSLK